jgi:peptide/nickel transport system substrate-binding protein
MHFLCIRLAVIAILAVPALAWAAPQGTVVVAQGVDPTTLDPQNHQETPAANLAVNMFDSLLERDQDLKIIPMLAESYKIVAPTVWEFKLRKGVRFHNGEPFDAEAVKVTVERMVDPKLKLRGATPWAPLSHAEIVDPQTVRIHTKAPWPILDTMVTTLPILAPKYYKEKELAHVAKNPVGSGPFKFVRWVKDDRIELAANAQYWRNAPRAKSLVFRPIPDDAVRSPRSERKIDIAVNIRRTSPTSLRTTRSSSCRRRRA